jgi:hypothetical protein
VASTLKQRGAVLLLLPLLLAACKRDVSAEQAPVQPRAQVFETAHYRIESRASDEETRKTADATESLHRAYLHFFDLPDRPRDAKLRLMLDRDRADFKRHNRSSPWAEAYYRPYICHAYYARNALNPYHWMLHEATHQLNREVAGLQRRAWIEEGLATYFGASRLEDGELRAGIIDPAAYPIWWLPKLPLSGDLQPDVREERFIALRALITGSGGPPIDRHVNEYYVGYWSLTYFLFHYDGGKYADGYRKLIAKGGGIDDFETLIGPVSVIEAEWYGYLRESTDSPKLG